MYITQRHPRSYSVNMSQKGRSQRSFNVEIHKWGKNEIVYDKVADYASLKLNCSFNHDSRPDSAEYLRECSRYLSENPARRLGERYDAGDPEAFLETGSR